MERGGAGGEEAANERRERRIAAGEKHCKRIKGIQSASIPWATLVTAEHAQVVDRLIVHEPSLHLSMNTCAQREKQAEKMKSGSHISYSSHHCKYSAL